MRYSVATTQSINVSDVDLDFDNCRRSFTAADVQELAQQIRDHGLLQAVVVRRRANGRYQLIAGFRRFTAISQLLKWETIEAKVMDVTDHEAGVINLLENLGRKDLDCVARARAIERLYPEAICSLREAAKGLKQHTQYIQHHRALLKLPEDVQEHFASGRIPLARVMSLLNSPDQAGAVKALLGRKSVRQPCKGLQRRNKAAVVAMCGRLLDMGFELHARLLMWSVGSVSDEALENDLEKAVSESAS